MEKIRKNAAGIDIGSRNIFVSVESEPVQSFETFTESFYHARDYLLSKGIETVAMEATGVYWVILYDVLEQAGLDVWLVDGRQTKQVPGRKTDVKDCAWIRQLHSYGLLNRCFVPDDSVKEIRAYQRMREDHIRSASMHVNHMQKALTEMNIRLKEVLSQIHGASGMAIIEAILAGERNAETLLSLCYVSIREKKAEAVRKSLNGYYTPTGLFGLKQAYDAYQFYQQQIKACDQQLQQAMERLNSFHQDKQSEKEITSAKGRKPIRHNKPDVDHLGGHLLKIFSGTDATQLPGITDYSWLQLYAEVGKDLINWPTEKHFTSWLGLSPGQHQSGKKNKSRSKKYRPKAGQIFRQIAQSLIESKKIALGAFGRRLKSKRGPGIAVKATAR
ncbi:MAG: IS110 family transposase, partial [Cytophagales bacterium CG17_big_fil_post_rev_8_21_14_2_50_40_13]